MALDLVTIHEAKLWCRIDGNHEDEVIAMLIGAASAAVSDLADGWTPGEVVPDRIKLAVLTHILNAYDQREADLPASAVRLVFPLRRLGV